MKRFFLFFCMVLFCCNTFADDLVLKSGTTYKNFQIYKVDSSGFSIMHEYGVATIPFSDLPDELRTKYQEQEKQFIAAKKAKAEAWKKRREELKKIIAEKEARKKAAAEQDAARKAATEKSLQKTTSPKIAEKRYWQTAGTKKVHNALCRYYKKSAGEMVSGLNGGTNCKICGGTGKGDFEKKSENKTSSGTADYTGTNTVYTGPRGGRYYINSNGKKTYIRRKK